MDRKKVYVVTDVDLGWDNVIGVYTNKEAADACVKARGEDSNIVHDEYLDDTYLE